MAPPTWATKEQRQFLLKEDPSWTLIKASGRTLKSFYTQTTRAFLEKWPRTPSVEILALAKGDEAAAKALVEQQAWDQIASWYGNLHRKKKALPAAPKPLLDLAGKHTRKKPPLQKWQAFSALYYRPADSPLRVEVRSLFERRDDPAAVLFLADFLPPDTDITKTDFLTFHGAFMRKRCTHLSSDEEEQVNAYIEQQEQLVAEIRDQPWFAEDDYDDKPLLAENRYIQQRIDELPRVAQRALDEIEKATGYKAILIVGGLTPAEGGTISTHIHTTGQGVTTGLSFSESWDGIPDLRNAFGEWLMIAYTEHEKRRREGFSTSSLALPSNPSVDDVTSNGVGLADNVPADTIPDNSTPDNSTPENSTPENSTPENSTFDNTDSENPNPDNTEPENTTPDNTEPDNTTPDNMGPDDMTSDNTEPDNTTPDNTEPDNTTPDNTTPEEPTSTTMTILTAPACPFEHDQSYPGFITPAVVEYLNSVDGGLCWVEMVKNYLTLEAQYRLRRTGRLSLQHRPEEVILWGRQRDLSPTITDVQKFSEEWIAWWGNCQPKWRSTETWPYPRDDAKDRDWSRLNVTGTSGLFAVVMSTSWWAASAGLGPHREAFDSAVEDLSWVIENLNHFNSQLPIARIGQVNASEGNHFPGHGERDPGKRKIKPTPKVSNRN